MSLKIEFAHIGCRQAQFHCIELILRQRVEGLCVMPISRTTIAGIMDNNEPCHCNVKPSHQKRAHCFEINYVTQQGKLLTSVIDTIALLTGAPLKKCTMCNRTGHWVLNNMYGIQKFFCNLECLNAYNSEYKTALKVLEPYWSHKLWAPPNGLLFLNSWKDTQEALKTTIEN